MKELLYDALASEFGIAVSTDDPATLRVRLYPLRKSEPEFADLSFFISPVNPETELWIVKRVNHEKK